MKPDALIYTDGSCVFGDTATYDTGRGFGGWAAVVEHGSNGWTLRGREHKTTATRMELLAIIKALRSLDRGLVVFAYVDCTVALNVHYRWKERDTRSIIRSRDGDLWLQLADQLDRLDVHFKLVKGRANGDQHDRIHYRCHTIAGAEAKALRGDVRQLPKRLPPVRVGMSATYGVEP